MKKFVAFSLVFLLLISLSACGAAKSADLPALYSQMESTLPEMLVLDDNTMLNFLGINSADCTQVVASICNDGLRADEVWLIEAKDASAAESLVALAERRIESKKAETINYTPDQYLIVEKAELIAEGNYVILLVSPDVDALAAMVAESIQ